MYDLPLKINDKRNIKMSNGKEESVNIGNWK